MTTKILIIVGVSVAVVVGMFVLGAIMNKDSVNKDSDDQSTNE